MTGGARRGQPAVVAGTGGDGMRGFLGGVILGAVASAAALAAVSLALGEGPGGARATVAPPGEVDGAFEPVEAGPDAPAPAAPGEAPEGAGAPPPDGEPEVIERTVPVLPESPAQEADDDA